MKAPTNRGRKLTDSHPARQLYRLQDSIRQAAMILEAQLDHSSRFKSRIKPDAVARALSILRHGPEQWADFHYLD